MRNRLECLTLLALMCPILAIGCSGSNRMPPPSSKAKESAAAVVGKISIETNVTTVALTEEAERRLGIITAPVRFSQSARPAVYGGIVVAPPHGKASVIAPVAGMVVAVGSDAAKGLPIGVRVSANNELLRFLPWNASQASPLSVVERGQLAVSQATLERGRIDVDMRIQSANVELEAAQSALNRAQQMLKDRVGSQRAVEEAEARAALARESLNAAKAEREALGKQDRDDLDDAPAVSLVAPIAANVQNVLVSPGETVAAGQTLVELVDLDVLWVRVPVMAGEIGASVEVRIRALGGKEDRPSLKGMPIPGLPTVTPLTSTVDVYYEITQTEPTFRPGQKVEVTLFTGASERHATIPLSAVLYDIHGGSWVYAAIGPRTYQRARVDVLYVAEDRATAVLAREPKNGTSVVVEGAAELFGAEFGNDT